MKLRDRLRPPNQRSVRLGGDAVTSLTENQAISAALLVVTAVVAVVWANVGHSYESFWLTPVSVGFADHVTVHPARDWINSGLMTIFFVVIGLEARREFDLGDLRDRRRLVAPALVGVLAMAVPAAVYLLVTAGTPHAHGWGAALSTDTAFALGFLALLAGEGAGRLRVFLLTVLVVDDLISVLVASIVYSENVDLGRVALAAVLFALFALTLRAGIDQPLLYSVIGVAVWAALFGSGIDPVISGLAIGLLAPAHPPRREALEQATARFRVFREEPTVELARTASDAVTATQSPNDRLRRSHLPWSSLVIVPLFGLANAGVRLVDGGLTHALSSPVTWGILAAFLLGKPLGWFVASRLLRSAPVGGAGMVALGTVAAAPFTLSLLIADRAFEGAELNDAKAAILLSLVGALVWGSVAFAAVNRMDEVARARALQGDGVVTTDLTAPVDETVDHLRGPADADVTIVEYGDFECPHCGLAERFAREELAADAHVRYVWRHLPLHEVHPRAQLAAEAAEAAAAQGAFWDMHDRLLADQDDLSRDDLVVHARALGLDVDRFAAELDAGVHRGRVARDAASADAQDVAGTPTFFVNGRRHYGSYEFAAIHAAVNEARARALAGK